MELGCLEYSEEGLICPLLAGDLLPVKLGVVG